MDELIPAPSMEPSLAPLDSSCPLSEIDIGPVLRKKEVEADTKKKPRLTVADAQANARISGIPPAELLELIANLRRDLRNAQIDNDKLRSKIRAMELAKLKKDEEDIVAEIPRRNNEKAGSGTNGKRGRFGAKANKDDRRKH